MVPGAYKDRGAGKRESVRCSERRLAFMQLCAVNQVLCGGWTKGDRCRRGQLSERAAATQCGAGKVRGERQEGRIGCPAREERTVLLVLRRSDALNLDARQPAR
jgi:hypothetical protein